LLGKRGKGSADVAWEKRIVFKRRWNQGEHGFIGAETFEELELEGVVEAGGVADFSFQRSEPGTDGQASAEFALFGAEPTAVRDDGVDFAVVGDVTERLRKIPGRLRVCGVALVEDGERRGKRGVAEIFVKLRKLPRREEAFVDDRLRWERTEIAALWQKRFGTFAKESELPLESGNASRRVKWRDEELPYFGHRFESFAAERVGVGGDAAPAEDAEALGVGSSGYRCFSVGRCCRRKKREA
jgi:hypothetical protein